jgi:hypothetical protein
MPSTNISRRHAIAARIGSNQVQEMIIISLGQETNKMSGPISSSCARSAACLMRRTHSSTKLVELEYTPPSIAAHSMSTALFLLPRTQPLMLCTHAAIQTLTTSTKPQTRALPPSK